LVLIGIPGAGKSTQGNLLSKQLRIPYLSTGHIFREIAKEKTSLGRYVKEIMSSGLLIPDDKTIEIVNSYLSRSEYKNGYILDGFPRTLNQAKKFKNNVDKVIYMEIPDKEALWRLSARSDSRDDDTVKAIRKRIEVFHKFTEPVLDYYRKQQKFVVVDGLQPIKDVDLNILKSLGKQLVKDQIKNWERKQKVILAIVGLPGAGKTAAADYFKEKNIQVIEFGKIVNDYIEKQKLSHEEKNHKKVRESLRKEHGMAAFAKLNEPKIKSALEKNMIMVIDGLRSWEEYLYLKDAFKEVKIVLLALYADKELRYRRIARRGCRSHLYGEERDLDELIGINMAPTLGFADYFVDANSTLEDLNDKLEVVYRIIYFS
jgi:adenylate kinase